MSDFTVSVYQTYVSCAPGRRTWLYISSINRTTGKAGSPTRTASTPTTGPGRST